MRQLPLLFPDDEDLFTGAGKKVPSPAEEAILREIDDEKMLASLASPEERQQFYARIAAEERRRVVESRHHPLTSPYDSLVHNIQESTRHE